MISAMRFAALLGSVTLAASSVPDFSGTWVEATPAVEAAERQLARTESLFSKGLLRQQQVDDARAGVTQHRATSTVVITQTTAAIVLRRADGVESTYRLDGTESRNSSSSGPVRSRAAWDGDRLVINEIGTDKASVQRIWSLDQQGRLVIASGEGATKQVVIYKKP